MRRARGDPLQALRNLVGSERPLGGRLTVALRNLARRVGPPPRACCGHDGEPGC